LDGENGSMVLFMVMFLIFPYHNAQMGRKRGRHGFILT